MMSQMAPLYGSAAALIGMLITFSVHNRKTGWKRKRTTFTEALNNFYKDMGLAEIEPAVEEIPSLAPLQPAEAAAFSLQLLKLRATLDANQTSVSPELMMTEKARLVTAR